MLISPPRLKALTADILGAAGLPATQAATVADVLVFADRRGVWSHGVYRVDSYVQRILKGGVNLDPNVSIARSGPSAIAVQGDGGMGAVVASRSMNALISLVKETGAGVCAVGESGHFGMASAYTEMAAAAGQIGVVWTSTSAVMAPWGGRERLLGNNPIAVSLPLQGQPPLTLDMALSTVAGGRIRIFAERGEEIPLGWALDEDGAETTDATAAVRGSVMPIGGYKGYGLSLITEAIAVGLTGGTFGYEAPDLWEQPEARQSISHLLLAVDVAAFVPPATFGASVGRLLDRVKSSPASRADTVIQVPGEPERAHARAADSSGVDLPQSSVDSLRSAAAAVQISIEEFKEPR